ncbi:MAG: putative metal-dependent enzyme (double-stranded beta helix superfamily) [Candidatus Paceibacteria bacterium]|jgi:predicted metal-dependent enzyme (double-stranded beta helix superfamily)
MVRTGCSTGQLVDLLDEATKSDCLETITSGVKAALMQVIASGTLKLDEEALVPCGSAYGRRHLHTDPNGRYSVVAMIWGQDQGTPIHDHDDKWCVEGVYQGEILVTTYEICPTSDPDRVEVEFCGTSTAIIGEAGALIPPHDYHVIENKTSKTAVTIHVYGGEMKGCNVFEPVEGGKLFQKTWKSLCYND